LLQLILLQIGGEEGKNIDFYGKKKFFSLLRQFTTNNTSAKICLFEVVYLLTPASTREKVPFSIFEICLLS
jgi:hypothetical protein